MGEALVSFLDEKGRPNVVERAMVIAPESKMGMLGAEGLNSAINKSPLYGRYEHRLTARSAYEKLSSGGFATVGTAQRAATAGASAATDGRRPDGRIERAAVRFHQPARRPNATASSRPPPRAWRAISADRSCAACWARSPAAVKVSGNYRRQRRLNQYTVAAFFSAGPNMLLLIDNYDSFTYNLYQYFCELGAEVLVKPNDELQLADIERLAPQHLVISPGPCTPMKRVSRWPPFVISPGKLPILGVCPGHQALGQAFGAVVRARAVMHGKTSAIRHLGVGVFRGLNDPLTVTRYHSLVLRSDTLDCFEVTAWSERNGVRDEIMGIRHPHAGAGRRSSSGKRAERAGHQLLDNFLNR